MLLVSLLCSCGKKEELPQASAPAPQTAPPEAKPEPAPKPPAQPTTPEAKEQPAPPAPTKTPEPTVAGEEKTFSGTIGGQPVVLQLSFKNDAVGGRSTITGSYFLESQGTSNTTPLSGTLQDGNLVLEQTVQGAVTGTFDLLNDSANKRVYLGSWKGLGRVLPVKLSAAQ